MRFAFRSLEPVKIVEVGVRGVVVSRMNNAEGQNEYKVQYWIESKRTLDWFYEFELEAAG